MNFIKTSKFSVKGIDTTRYIPNEMRNLLLLFFGWSWGVGLIPPPFIVIIRSRFFQITGLKFFTQTENVELKGTI